VAGPQAPPSDDGPDRTGPGQPIRDTGGALSGALTPLNPTAGAAVLQVTGTVADTVDAVAGSPSAGL
jgi:hypothetical protein